MKYKLLLTIFFIAMVMSALLAFIPVSSLCNPSDGGGVSCSTVQNSIYSKTFGISNSYIGLVAFIALFFLTLSHVVKPKREKEMMIVIGVVIASFLAAYFIYLQAFVIKSFCIYCMIVDVASILALIIVGIYGMD